MRRDIGVVDAERAARWRYILDQMAAQVLDATKAAQRRATMSWASQGGPAAC